MAKFKPVDREIDFQKSENEWMEFWSKNDIFGKQLHQGRQRAPQEHPGNPTYVFFEGPPTANGIPHPGHVLTRVIKDLFPRFRAMQGYDVPRKAGWDTHGLPVEVSVEKELGIEGKQGIEDFGVEPFIKKCKDSVFRYSDLWAKMTARIGFWIDLNDPYVTYHQSYINSVWWSLQQIWNAGLIYHGHKIVPWCPRCGTALSSQEVGQGYKNVADPAAFVAFRSKEDPKLMFVAWTTTPWTLLSNVALAVGKDFDYDYVQVGEETLVMASALREKAMGKVPHTVAKTVKGAELLGKTYEQLFTYATVDKPAFRIIAGDFVGLDTGTGIVHIAPAYGEDDNLVGKQNDLPSINVVNTDGTFMDSVTPWKGLFVKEADKLILKELKDRKQLLKSEQYLHDYPFCWRCDSPLLYYPRPAWYIRTTEIKEQMLQNNATIHWHPEHIQDGRFGNFLETNVDWALSRERYWGTPLPIWECTSCSHSLAIGGEKELLERAANAADFPDGIELHKPYVDRVLVKCEQCGGTMKRVPEVIDCWYDSGAMHFAQWGYPHAEGSAEKLAAALPADFISEAIDQTRGWFYTLLAIATLLKESGRRLQEWNKPAAELKPWMEKDYPLPYRNCLVLGHVCDGEGYKMSKSKGNYLDPWEILSREGADAMRWYFYSSNQPWTSVRFVAEAIRDAQKDFLVRLRNVYSFFVIYANIDGFDPAEGIAPASLAADAFEGAKTYVPLAQRSQLDLWMLSKLESATAEVTTNLESMNILAAAQSLSALVEGLSNWFVRRSRDRFWQSAKDATKWSAYWTLYEALGRVATLAAPFVPFMAEELYQRCFRELLPSLPESVHLLPWPTVCLQRLNPEVETKMDLVREIASLGLSARAAFKLKVRQPLSRAVVILTDHSPTTRAAVAELSDVVRDELNVHELEFADDAAQYVKYQIKPDFKKLGPKLGKDVKACAAKLAQADAAALVAGLAADGVIGLELDGKSYELTAEELDVRIDAKEGFAAASGRGAVVAIDSALTPELEREGLARELVNRVQGVRKELDLPYEARIKLRIGTGGSLARAALEYAEYIAAETLAGDYKVEFEPLHEVREFVIADEQVRIALQAI